MSTPQWRESRPSSPYGSEPGARPRGRDPRAADDTDHGPVPGYSPTGPNDPWSDAPTRQLPAQPGATQPGRVARGAGGQRGDWERAAARRPQGPGGPRDPRGYGPDGGAGAPRLGGSLSGGLGVAIVAASTALGASATMLMGKEPGSILGAFVVIGTAAAAVAVRPQAGRVILPVPALAYIVAAMVTGVIYDRSADASKTALAINAAQWIANGFFAMALATIAAVVIVTGRWIIWRRGETVSPARGRPADQVQPQADLDGYWDPAPYEDTSGTAPGAAESWRGVRRQDQYWPPRADPRQAQPPGPDPYNFSSGA
jgi:hypothetical protein